MKAIVFGVLMLIGICAFGQGAGKAKYEMMIVEEWTNNISDTKLRGLHIFQQKQEPKFIPISCIGTAEGLINHCNLVEQEFAKFYDEGWRLISSTYDKNYDSGTPRYFFEREKP